MQNDDVRAQLIRAFPAEVVEARGSRNELYYACPTCSRAVAQGMDKCMGCSQVLSWKNINELMASNTFFVTPNLIKSGSEHTKAFWNFLPLASAAIS